jgi:hypothetical protein
MLCVSSDVPILLRRWYLILAAWGCLVSHFLRFLRAILLTCSSSDPDPSYDILTLADVANSIPQIVPKCI